VVSRAFQFSELLVATGPLYEAVTPQTVVTTAPLCDAVTPRTVVVTLATPDSAFDCRDYCSPSSSRVLVAASHAATVRYTRFVDVVARCSTTRLTHWADGIVRGSTMRLTRLVVGGELSWIGSVIV
jgi:hypothetical protein